MSGSTATGNCEKQAGGKKSGDPFEEYYWMENADEYEKECTKEIEEQAEVEGELEDELEEMLDEEETIRQAEMMRVVLEKDKESPSNDQTEISNESQSAPTSGEKEQ